jgi:molybdate transport system ATP-binding protein
MLEVNLIKGMHAAGGLIDLNVSFTIKKGSVVALYGTSGSGKTTLLRMLAGLVPPDAGRIVMDGLVWYDHNARVNVRPQYRNIGMVFQNYALFPNMSVQENLTYGISPNAGPEMLEEALEVAGLTGLRKKKPHQLSGGQQQRVSLCRALLRMPTLLLLDEPLTAVDTEMRAKLQQYIARMHRHNNMTTVLVTHDILEVLSIAEQVLKIDGGQLLAQGPPTEVLPLQTLSRLIEQAQKNANS